MIGFQTELHCDAPQRDEGDDTKGMDKKKLYNMLALLYYLPLYHSKGVTREYLLSVHKDRVFRVPIMEFKHFEVDLTPKMTKQVGVVNNAILVRKLNVLLITTNRKPLGFEEFDPPEQVNTANQTWLYRVARFIDPTNLTEFFESPVFDEPSLNHSSSIINKIYVGRLKASAYFFRLKEAKSNKKLWEALRQISDTYRMFTSQRISVEVLKKDFDSAEQKAFILGNLLDDLISKCAFTYTSIENPLIKPDMIINGSDKITKDIRDNIMLNCQL